jgi:hypothetical protein
MKYTSELETAQCPTCKGSGMSKQKRCHALINPTYRDEYRCPTIAKYYFIGTEKDGQQKYFWFCGTHANSLERQHNVIDVEEA